MTIKHYAVYRGNEENLKVEKDKKYPIKKWHDKKSFYIDIDEENCFCLIKKCAFLNDDNWNIGIIND